MSPWPSQADELEQPPGLLEGRPPPRRCDRRAGRPHPATSPAGAGARRRGCSRGRSWSRRAGCSGRSARSRGARSGPAAGWWIGVAVEGDLALVDVEEAGDAVEERRLAGAVGTDDAGDRALLRSSKSRFPTATRPPKRLVTPSASRMRGHQPAPSARRRRGRRSASPSAAAVELLGRVQLAPGDPRRKQPLRPEEHHRDQGDRRRSGTGTRRTRGTARAGRSGRSPRRRRRGCCPCRRR